MNTAEKTKLPPINDKQEEEDVFITQKGNKMSLKKDETLSSTLLMKKKRQLESVQIDLDKKRVEIMKRMEEIREQREGLKNKQKQLKERVAKFEKFLSESHAKRQRALAKAQNEQKLKMAKEEEIYQLKQVLEQERLKQREIVESIKYHKVYEQFLQSVIKILPSNYFNTNEPAINDILLRHKTLFETNTDLVKSIEQNQQSIEDLQDKLAKIIKEKDDTVLVYNSMLGQHQKEYEKLVQEVRAKEQRQDEYYKAIKEKLRILGETKLAVHSLYERVMMIPWLSVQHTSEQKPATQQQKKDATQNVSLGSVDSMDSKLHTIREKLIDLKNLVDKAQFLNHTKRKL